ncbi:MAG TPA: hypothetical protein VFY18_10755 [Candidatus Limnocylindrales bacterium]|nr:hypothetical protein [Candidatus Limnocylindrales bacterium]
MPDRAPRRPIARTGRPADAPPVDDDLRGLPPTVQPDLAPGEELLFVLRGIGAAMFVTTDRLVVARDGGDRRPRSGTQSFSLDAISHIRVEPGERPSGRIAVWIGMQEVISMFFDARSADRANEAVATARPLIARRRRERQAIARRMSG